MKTFWIIAFLFLATASGAQAQATPEQVLATAGTLKFTTANLPPDVAASYAGMSQTVAELRAMLLEQYVGEAVFGLEAKARGVALEKFVADIKAKVPDPSEADVKAVYEANREALGGRDLASIRPQLVAFLRQDPENKALGTVFESLRDKYKIVRGKDVNAAGLLPADLLVTIAGRPVTLKEFETEFRVQLYEARAKIYDDVRFALGAAIYGALVRSEATAAGLDTTDYLQREISDKVKDYSAEERDRLESALRKSLFAKYKVTFLLKEPTPLVLNIGVADAPSKGPATAPVTLVMFSDFQCPHCALTHSLLGKILADYGTKVRFVVREFPLESIHPNAFDAARAANAAGAQGKFFEYLELLYRNQEAQDRDSLRRYAQEIGLNLQRFELDFESEKNAAAVRKDLADGRSYGISGTPTLFVNGVRIRLATPDGIREAIDRALPRK